LQGVLMRAFSVRNRRGKVLAIGAVPNPKSPGFVIMRARRYENDADLRRAIERLTGIAPRVHEWQTGRKGCARVIRPEVRHG